MRLEPTEIEKSGVLNAPAYHQPGIQMNEKHVDFNLRNFQGDPTVQIKYAFEIITLLCFLENKQNSSKNSPKRTIVVLFDYSVVNLTEI